MTVLELLAQDHERFVRFAVKITGSHEAAEDAVQNTAVIAARRRRRQPPDPLAWLFVVIRHECYAGFRRQRASVPLDEILSAAAHLPDADSVLDARAALARVKPDQRRALLGRAVGLSYRDMAQQWGWTYTKVNRSVSEGRAAAREFSCH